MINFAIVTSRKIKDCIDLIYNVKFKISHMKGFSLVMIERIKLCISYKYRQGCHWSGKSQGNSRSGKSQGILEFVREIWNFVGSQGNSRKVREI